MGQSGREGSACAASAHEVRWFQKKLNQHQKLRSVNRPSALQMGIMAWGCFGCSTLYLPERLCVLLGIDLPAGGSAAELLIQQRPGTWNHHQSG